MSSDDFPVVISMGDPHGIGPEVALKALSDWDATGRQALIFGDASYLSALRADLRLEPQSSVEFRHTTEFEYPPKWGTISARAGRFAVDALGQALEYCRNKSLPLLVTAPINKQAATLGGFDHPGQTEFVSSYFGQRTGAMAFFSPILNVILATVHVPLREVFHKLSTHLVVERTRQLGQALRDLGISHPRLALCGLNPHASEDGLFGDEERLLLSPALTELRQEQSFSIDGPISPDTVFYRACVRREFDGVVALYHDQALIPLKLVAFDCAVNATLGLPIVRTSPDHGTAFAIAGKGQADARSMREAIQLGIRLVEGRSES